MVSLEEKIGKIEIANGSVAMARAVNLARVDVVSAYPITPQTLTVEALSDYRNNGRFNGEFVDVESEHSAPSLLIGAALKGCRTFTATASQGALYMHEVLFNVAGMRLPIVMGVSNRSVSAPLNILNDQQDSFSQRDTGWMQMYVTSNQQALDGTLLAYRIAEQLKLPCMVCMDGFTLSHLVEPVIFPSQEAVDRFLPPYSLEDILDPSNPKTFGFAIGSEGYMLTRLQMQQAMEQAKGVIRAASKEFEDAFGRPAPKLIDSYQTDGADIVLVSTGSVGALIREVIGSYNGKYTIGHVDLTFYRPFPGEDLRKALAGTKAIGVVDRNISLGATGAVYADLAGALAGRGNALMENYITGLGGKDRRPEDIRYMINDLVRALETKQQSLEPKWVGYEKPVEDKYQQSFSNLSDGRKGIIFHGRGGQGAMTAAILLAHTAFSPATYAHAFPTFGPEREGAPLRAFTRINSSGTVIGDRSEITEPDYVVVLDRSLIGPIDVTQGLKPGGTVIVNYAGNPVDLGLGDNGYKLICIDASGIAKTYIGRNFPNTPLVGAVAAQLEIPETALENAIRANMPRGTEGNVKAALAAYNMSRGH